MEQQKACRWRLAARYRFGTSLWLLSEITTCRREVAGLNEGPPQGNNEPRTCVTCQ